MPWDHDKAYRLMVTPGTAEDVTVVGFQAVTAETANVIVDRLRSLGYELVAGTGAECAARRADGLWRTTAPWGVPVEIVHGLAEASTPFESELVPDGFKTEGVGFGHAVFLVADPAEADRFFVEGLGMRQTDWLDLPIAPGVVMTGRFYHCNPRHHTLALIGVREAPKRLHHIMFETNALDAVGAAFDRAFAAGVPIAIDSASTTTTRCSASTSRPQPDSRSRSDTVHVSSEMTGTKTAPTTGSACGAINPSPGRWATTISDRSRMLVGELRSSRGFGSPDQIRRQTPAQP